MKGSHPWFEGQAEENAKRHAPAAIRNRDAIADVLAIELPSAGRVLEVASGSGEHVLHFAARFPAIDWQPSDPDLVAQRSIAAWVAGSGQGNIHPPLDIDTSLPDWPVQSSDALLCINMTHISPWQATLGLFDGAARLLDKGAPLIFYGPFLSDDIVTAQSNLDFDMQLRSRNPAYGLRRVEDMDVEASNRGLRRSPLYSMPANNLMLIYRIN